MNTQDPFKHMPDFLRTAIEKQIQMASDEEFEKMKQRLDERKAEIVAGAVLYAQRMFDVQTMVDRVVITVKLENK